MTGYDSFLLRLRAVARRQPHLPALLSDGRTALSYGHLYARAAALGARLADRGVGPGDVIGLLLPRSADYVVALLGAWFAGAAFVPLDPRLPPNRLRFLAQDAGVRLAVAAAACDLDGVPCVALAALLDGEPATGEPARVAPDDLAYVIYTSGTTGTPRGVLIPHRGLVSLFEAQIAAFRLAPGSRALLYLSISFDASLSDIGTALLSGATLCIETDEVQLTPAALPALLTARGITHLDLPPALLRILDPGAMPPTLTTLVIGGEPCPPPIVRRWAAERLVVNVYGPTEATICASLCSCDPVGWDRPLLGRPIPGVTFDLLEEGPGGGLRPAPAGTPAELFIGGAGLALGYRNAPALTAGKFIQWQGRRLYRTGDRVVRHPDGEYEFLGRLDRQIKLRGLRIEPEEIETLLLTHGAVLHAAVVRHASAPLLCAYVVARPGSELTGPALRRHLAATLPRWMLPQRIVLLQHLPRTPSGKIDLRALEEHAAPDDLAARPATTGREAQLAELFQRVLRLPAVDVHADYFALGGDSLQALEVVAAAQALGVTLPPDLLLSGATVAEMAAQCDAHARVERPLRCAELILDVAPLLEQVDPALRRMTAREPTRSSEPRQILLTGAAGFLGSRLLGELLRRTSAQITCLVRSRDDAQARDRVLLALAAHYGEREPALLQQAADPLRLHVLHGDLEHPQLGLAQPVWERLAEDVDTVYHLAALVHLLWPYHALRPSNVQGTSHILRLCTAGRPKRLHYASTLSVLLATGHPAGVLPETDELPGAAGDAADAVVYGGYAQSKWAAEHLVRSAAPGFTCYRLGLITADSSTGYAAPNDHLSLFLRGAAALGCLPDASWDDLRCDITPVDFAAAALAHLSLTAPPGTFHIANQRGLPVADLVQALRSFGCPIAAVSPGRWREQLLALPDGPAQAAAYLALCRCLSADQQGDLHRGLDLFQMTGVTFDLRRTAAALAGLTCPPPDQALLRTYLRRLFQRSPGA